MNLKAILKKHGEKILAIAVIAGFVLVSQTVKSRGSTPVYDEPLVNETGLAYNNTYTLNVNGYKGDTLSLQVTYASQTLTTYSFTDGSQSTATITVSQAGNATALTTATASDFLTVLTTGSITGSQISIGAITLVEGQQWTADTSFSTWTAVSIKNAINTYVPQVTATLGNAPIALGAGTGRPVTVFTTTTVGGLYGNNTTMVSNNSSITVNAATFTGGHDNDCVSLNGVMLCANRDFGVGASSAVTAFNLANTIRANTSLNTVISATAPANCTTNPTTCGVVIATSVIEGVASKYALFSSTKSALVLAGNTVTSFTSSSTMSMFGGTDPAYSLNGTQITLPAHGLTSGIGLSFSTSSAVGISGLKFGTTYFVSVIDANTISLSSRSADAVSGINFNQLNSSSTKVTGNSFQLIPSTWVAGATWKYQASNDGTTWTDIATPAALATYAVGTAGVDSGSKFVFPSTTTISDVGAYDYSYLRVNVTAPTTGQILLKVVPNLKTNK